MAVKALAGVPIVNAGDDIATLVTDALAASGENLQAGDVIVLAQKIVSKAEGRRVDLKTVTPSAKALELAKATSKDPRLVELILSESTGVVRAVSHVIVVEHRLGFVMANAGIDQSNLGAAGHDDVLLLPKDPDASSAAIRAALRQRIGVDVAVLIIDSVGRAWRNGTVGMALGVSGLPALLDLRGRADLFGRTLQSSELGLADEVAAAASLVMGQADEGRPIVLMRGVPYARGESHVQDLLRPRGMDLFR
ncbi:MAG: coenzyme F420-0:L-glutamate ligase [Rhodospirillaceae bacterium]|nr:coenzyme F420-0:L-glutamate ligase [Rhodospirillaceae bacterium]